MMWDVVSGARSASSLGMPGGRIHRVLDFILTMQAFFLKRKGGEFVTGSN